MKIIKTVEEMRQYSRQCRQRGLRLACVPTMGYLHEGHASLISAARHSHDEVVTSIFVNPTQFGPHEDFERYPRDFDRDHRVVDQAGGTVIFAPSVDEMYPLGASTSIAVRGVSEPFEGAFRPGHFTGVATIVARLLLAIEPDAAFFGAKDFQQTLVIRRMVHDLGIASDVIVLSTIREADGLAKSSRNVYLTADQRHRATALYRALRAAEDAIHDGAYQKQIIDNAMHDVLRSVDGIEIDYASAADASTLATPDIFEEGARIVCLIAVRLGSTRLIDNMEFTIGMKA
jgi:pantoate--beta-alanine ligase